MFDVGANSYRVVTIIDYNRQKVYDSTHPLYTLFELVMHLIEQWENEHVHFPDPPLRDLLRFLLEANDLKPTDLGDLAPPELLGDILSGQRDIDEDLAKALSKRFHIDVKAFI